MRDEEGSAEHSWRPIRFSHGDKRYLGLRSNCGPLGWRALARGEALELVAVAEDRSPAGEQEMVEVDLRGEVAKPSRRRCFSASGSSPSRESAKNPRPS